MARKKQEHAKPRDIRIEYPLSTDSYFQHRWGVFEYIVGSDGDDNAGQTSRILLNSFDRREDAVAYYPEATLPNTTPEE
jgi:hypothetical protein